MKSNEETGSLSRRSQPCVPLQTANSQFTYVQGLICKTMPVSEKIEKYGLAAICSYKYGTARQRLKLHEGLNA
jgi:hypothetical protein